MKLKKFISLLLLSVYLFATGGPAWASLTCKCVLMRPHAAHACCCCCASDEGISARQAMRAPCCGNHHSTDVKLYTGVSENEKYVKRVVLELPPSLAAEFVEPIETTFVCVRIARRRTPPARAVHVPGAGLRAPPVLA